MIIRLESIKFKEIYVQTWVYSINEKFIKN